MYELLTQEVNNVMDSTDILTYIYSVVFYTKDSTIPKLSSCDWTSKKLSALLWGMRACVCGYLTLLCPGENENWNFVAMKSIDPVQNGHIINVICPMISHLRRMHDSKARVKDNFFDEYNNK